MHRGNIIQHSFAVGLLSHSTLSELRKNALFRISQFHASVVANHIKCIANRQIIFCLKRIKHISTRWRNFVGEFQQSQVHFLCASRAHHPTWVPLQEFILAFRTRTLQRNAQLTHRVDFNSTWVFDLLKHFHCILRLFVFLLHLLSGSHELLQALFISSHQIAIFIIPHNRICFCLGLRIRIAKFLHICASTLLQSRHNGCEILLHQIPVDWRRSHMPIGKQSALLVDEERCTVTHSWILLHFLHIFSKVLYIPVFVKPGKIQRVARWQLHLIVILINHHHHTRLLLIVQLLRLLSASTKQHRSQHAQKQYLFHNQSFFSVIQCIFSVIQTHKSKYTSHKFNNFSPQNSHFFAKNRNSLIRNK